MNYLINYFFWNFFLNKIFSYATEPVYPIQRYPYGYSSENYYPGNYPAGYSSPWSGVGNILNFGIGSGLNVLGVGVNSGLGITIG